LEKRIDFQVEPSSYRHWRVEYSGEIATLLMDVDEEGGLFDGYPLKLNSYDLGVDIELADIVQRMRFEHPEVRVVVLRSGKANVFCAGANIRMLAGATHAHKVNFCKFTNETRNTFENAESDSNQKYMAAIKGACAGGGYELALACNYIMLTDDSSSSVALPEIPLLAVLPGTGGLTRVTDKRKVRRDRADVFCTVEEGIRGERAQNWNLVDEVAPNSRFDATVAERAEEFAAAGRRAETPKGIKLEPIEREFTDENTITYSGVQVIIDRAAYKAELILSGPDTDAPADATALESAGCQSYLLRLARELDDAILHLRLNEVEIGLLVFRSQGDSNKLLKHQKLLLEHSDHWLANEILHYWKRVLQRIDLTSRSMIALIENGSCFYGVLAEILWSVDRCYMMEGEFEDDDRPSAAIIASTLNFGPMPMINGLTRLATRFLDDDETLAAIADQCDQPLDAAKADELGLVTEIYDDIDWEDELRLIMEERASFSPDAMTAMEANLRFAGPETMETRIFGRLTAWQNWIFTRPNASGDAGALRRYGTGVRGEYDRQRV